MLVVAQVAYRRWRGDFALVLTLDGVVGSSQASCSMVTVVSMPEENQAVEANTHPSPTTRGAAERHCMSNANACTCALGTPQGMCSVPS